MPNQYQSLYGGAASIEFPAFINVNYKVVDVSQFRQVPDTQEVFMLEPANLATSDSPSLDKSLVVDLLEMVSPQTYDPAIEEHLADMFADTDKIPDNVFVVKKNNISFSFVVHPNDRRDAIEPAAPSMVITFLAFIRIEKVTTDVLISMNVPSSEGMSEQELFATLTNELMASHLRKDFGAFMDIALSFKIADWSLFG